MEDLCPKNQPVSELSKLRQSNSKANEWENSPKVLLEALLHNLSQKRNMSGGKNEQLRDGFNGSEPTKRSNWIMFE